MVLVPIGNGLFTGFSGDRPTAGVGSGVRFLDNTGEESYFNGSVWLQTPRSVFSGSNITGDISGSPIFAGSVSVSGNLIGTIDVNTSILKNFQAFDTLIYKEGSTYYARRTRDGVLISGSTTLNGVVQAALDERGTIFWADSSGAVYQPSTALSANPWKIDSYTYLVIAPQAQITLPSTYSGRVFEISDTYSGAHVVQNIVVEGGRFNQGGGTPSAEWVLFTLESNSDTAGAAGIVNCTFRNIYCKRPRRMFDLIATSGARAYINGNHFDSLWCDYPRQGISFDMAGSGESDLKTISRNSFVNCVIQGDPGATSGNYLMTHGIHDIGGKANSFVSCKIWDTVSGRIDTNITNKASDTAFHGSMMTRQPAEWEITQDLGARTWITADSHNVGSNVALGNPLQRKTGAFYGIGNAGTNVQGDGLLQGLGSQGTISVTNPLDAGLGKRADTGTTSGTLAGIRTASTYTMRLSQPFLAAKIRLGQLSGTRFFFGFFSTTAVGVNTTTEDILSGIQGFGIGYSQSSAVSTTNWLVYSNAAGSGTNKIDTGIPANSGINILYVAGYDSSVGGGVATKFVWRIGNVSGQTGEVTTPIPSQSVALGGGIVIGNTVAESKVVDAFSMFTKNNNNDTG